MHSLGSSTKCLSRSSLSSTPSLFFSESDQTEDEADVFSSEGEGEAAGGKLSPDSFSLVRDDRGNSGLSHGGQRSLGTDSQAGQCPLLPSSANIVPTEGDITFAQKCAELRGYIRPLLELLNGLKMGRYDKGLSTFQQSVAMDRLQRILGILQKPHLGEKHLRTLLQLEMMLKVWFPQVKAAAAPQNSTGLPPARWHQDQLHIPVKKRRLSWSDSESSSPGQPFSKRPQEEDQHECQSDTSTGAPSSVHGETRGGGAQWMDFKKKIISGHCLKGSNHISSQPDLLSGSTQGVQKGTPSPLKMPPSSSGTQDSWISSTTPSSDSPQPSLLRQPSTGHRRDSVSLETEGNRAISTQGAESC